jgi:hypothetical protein
LAAPRIPQRILLAVAVGMASFRLSRADARFMLYSLDELDSACIPIATP